MIHFKTVVLLFYYILCLVYLIDGRISNFKRCADKDCSVPISLATTLLSYAADDERLISFKRNSEAKVYSKEAGDTPTLWEVQIDKKRGFAPKSFLREKKVLVKNTAVNVIVPTGRDSSLKQNSTQLNDENKDESNIVTPKLPSNSKGLFTTIGGVSADSVPPNSPDINPQASHPYEVFSGTTIYNDGTMKSNVENQTPTEGDEKSIVDTGQEKSQDTISTAHQTNNDESEVPMSENIIQGSETVNKKIDMVEVEEKTSNSISEPLKSILSGTKPDQTMKKTKEMKATDSLSEPLIEDNPSTLSKIQPDQDKPLQEAKETLLRDTQGDNSNVDKHSPEPDKLSVEEPGIFDGMVNTLTNFISSGSGGGENEEGTDNGDEDYEDEEEEENGDQISILGEVDRKTVIEHEVEEQLKKGDKLEINNDTNPIVDEAHSQDNLNDNNKETNIELNKVSNSENIDDVKQDALNLKQEEEKTIKDKDEGGVKVSTGILTQSNYVMDSGSNEVSSEKQIASDANNSVKVTNEKEFEEKLSDVTEINSESTLKVEVAITQDNPNKIPKTNMELNKLGVEESNKMSDLQDEKLEYQNEEKRTIESNFVPDTLDNEKSSLKGLSSYLNNASESDKLKPSVSPTIFSDDKVAASYSSADNAKSVIVNNNNQPQLNQETVPFVPKDNEIPDSNKVKRSTGTTVPVDGIDDEFQSDDQNDTMPLPENFESMQAVPKDLSNIAAHQNSDTIEQNYENKQTFFYKPRVVNHEQAKDPEIVEITTHPLSEPKEYLASVITGHSTELPPNQFPELSESPVLEKSFSPDVDVNTNNAKVEDIPQDSDIPEADHVKTTAGDEEVVETPQEENSISVPPEEQEDTEVIENLAVDDAAADVPNEVSSSWFEPLVNLFSFFDSTKENGEIVMSEERVDNNDSPLPGHIVYNKDETCTADRPEASCETLTPHSSAEPSETTWQESLYRPDMSATLELLEKVPLDVTIWLSITAIVVLIFSLGYYYIEAHKRDGPLVAIINKLEREVLVLKKESCILDDRLQIAQEQLEAWNANSSENDALIVELKQDLEETKALKAELEEQVAALEREVETVTESGLEMHRLLSESLSSQDGSQVLLSTVESLREKLENQEIEISNLNQKLSQKNTEVEELEENLSKSSEVVSRLEEKILCITREREEEALELKDKHRQLIAQLEEVMETKALDETRVSTELSKLRLFIEELQKTVAEKDLELDELKEVVKQVRSTDSNEKMDALFDVVSVRALLKAAITERDDFKERFHEEEGARKLLEGHMKKISQEVAELKISYEAAEKEKIEALTKLQVLSNYFKEKESQLQKELGLQESMWLQKQSDDHSIYEQMRSLREENEKYKLQNESLKKEIVDQESSFKIQLANVEQKSHENWVASRQAERRLKEVQQEAAQLRNRLTMEKNTANYSIDESKHNISESNGDPSSSPPSMLFPSTRSPPFMMYPHMPPPGDFVPPPPFMGSPYPSEGRQPPLGRISSPPLDHRFSPPPPLSYPSYDYPHPPYGHHSPSPPPPLPTHPHHRNVHKPQPRELPRDAKDLSLSTYSPDSDKTTRRNKR